VRKEDVRKENKPKRSEDWNSAKNNFNINEETSVGQSESEV
jgi:hypothetical protein